MIVRALSYTNTTGALYTPPAVNSPDWVDAPLLRDLQLGDTTTGYTFPTVYDIVSFLLIDAGAVVLVQSATITQTGIIDGSDWTSVDGVTWSGGTFTQREGGVFALNTRARYYAFGGGFISVAQQVTDAYITILGQAQQLPRRGMLRR